MSVNLGPFGFSMTHIIFFIACGLAFLLAWFFGKRKQLPVTDAIFRVLAVTLIVARVSFVVRHGDLYLSEPWQIFNVRDGGFDLWMGIAGGAAMLLWEIIRRRPLVAPLLIASLAGLIVYLGLQFSYGQRTHEATIPNLTLHTLSGRSVTIDQSFRGQPVVFNLWATWCPPCVREMPLLAEAQSRWPDVAFVIVNQGETAAQVSAFMQEHNLQIDHNLLDTQHQFSHTIDAHVLPTTLFFNAYGELVDTHVGEFSSARLFQGVQRMRGEAPRPSETLDEGADSAL
ncbi:MAG: TlpA family protein disulfide reductase [Idiomarina sp.]|nr:TlpA family protein disulfide reductase [Idiomarina sp.]